MGGGGGVKDSAGQEAYTDNRRTCTKCLHATNNSAKAVSVNPLMPEGTSSSPFFVSCFELSYNTYCQSSAGFTARIHAVPLSGRVQTYNSPGTSQFACIFVISCGCKREAWHAAFQ